jgi:UDP-N-acetylmuramoyl-tripeptide--D-alanyl-D-alanine ligase
MDMIMEQITAGQVESSTGGILIYGSQSAIFSGISIDSRTVRAGDLFFAIRGLHHDGHQYVNAALNKGAAGAVVDRKYELPGTFPANRILLQVADTHQALKGLAADVRQRWRGSLVAITGSMGKTTAKEFTFHVLQTEFSVYRSPGNFNNLFGLPLAIFGLSPEDHIGIFEMGMSAPGEIREMCRIAKPDVGVITNVAPVHLEFFGSLEEIARVKGELAEELRPDGTLVYNADDPMVSETAVRFPGNKISFGFSQIADVRAEGVEILGLEETRFHLTCGGITRTAMIPLGGVHYVINALPAVALGRHYRMEMDQILEGLRNLQQAPMRGQIVRFQGGFTIIDDSYNSNPRALCRMIDTLAAAISFRRRILVAGEMLELGPTSESLHYECGVLAAQRGLDIVVGVQGAAREIVRGATETGIPESRALFFSQVEPAGDFVSREVHEGDLVLIKGSRGVHLEKIVQDLRSHFTQRVG